MEQPLLTFITNVPKGEGKPDVAWSAFQKKPEIWIFFMKTPDFFFKC